MKYLVHRNFRGSQDGVTVTDFTAGDIVEISEYLAPHVGGWARPVTDGPDIENKAVISDGAAKRRKKQDQ
jgi:hypothetical protein